MHSCLSEREREEGGGGIRKEGGSEGGREGMWLKLQPKVPTRYG